jgi:hypothetical protein
LDSKERITLYPEQDTKLLNTTPIKPTKERKPKQMARGKAISVKIPTERVIKALEGSLATLEVNWTSQEANEAKYNKAMEAWRKEVMEFAVERIAKAENLRTNFRSWNKTLNVDFDLTVSEGDFPAEPERNYTTLHKHEYETQKEEISNAIRILKMTDEEVVNTSTYNAVARYL